MQNFRKFREVPLMSRPSSRSSSDPQNNALLVVAMLAMVAVPAGIALHTVRIPAPTQIPPADATPYGYTVSLLLFIIPIIVIGWWFVPHEGIKIPKRAFSRTISVLFIAGCARWTTSLPIAFLLTGTPPPLCEFQRQPWAGRCPLRSTSFT